MPDRERYNREPLTGDDNAHHREMWENYSYRRWMRSRMEIYVRWALALVPLISFGYVIWQNWHGK